MKSKWFLAANIVASVATVLLISFLGISVALLTSLLSFLIIPFLAPIAIVGWIGYQVESHNSALICAVLSVVYYIKVPVFCAILVGLYVVAYFMQKKLNDPHYIPKSERTKDLDSGGAAKAPKKKAPPIWSDCFDKRVRIVAIIATVVSLVIFVCFAVWIVISMVKFSNQIAELKPYQILSGTSLALLLMVLRGVLIFSLMYEGVLIALIWIGYCRKKRWVLWTAAFVGIPMVIGSVLLLVVLLIDIRNREQLISAAGEPEVILADEPIDVTP